jgi:hypothetical protein
VRLRWPLDDPDGQRYQSGMKASDLSKPIRCAFFLPLLTVSACDQLVPERKPTAHITQAVLQRKPTVGTTQPDAIVASFYKEVVARKPIAGMGDPKVFGSYLSRGLRHRFDDSTACYADWVRQNPGTTDKPPFGKLEMGVYSGGVERSGPQTFQIEKTEAREGGSSRVYVKLTYAEPTFKLVWRVAAVVVRENGRPVLDDVIYLQDENNPEEYRLSGVLSDGCNGPRWTGHQ